MTFFLAQRHLEGPELRRTIRAQILALLEHPEQVTQLKGCLENAGHEVYTVDSLRGAKALLQDRSFDLIISDVHLENGGTVFDFLKCVKTNRRFQTSPFVLISLKPSYLAKYLAGGVFRAARALGAAKYICMDTLDSVLLRDEIAELLPARSA